MIGDEDLRYIWLAVFAGWLIYKYGKTRQWWG
jgi:hypothetical protein